MNQHTVTNRPSFRDPMAEEQYRNAEDTLLSLARTQGMTDGQSNTPINLNEFRTRFCSSVYAHIQDCLSEHALHAQNITGVMMATKVEKEAKLKIQAVQNELAEDQIRLTALTREAERIKPNRNYNLIRTIIHIGLAFMAIGEGALAYPALRSIPLATNYALMAAAGASIAVLLGAHLGAGFIQRSKTRPHYLSRLIGIHITAFAFFYLLSVLRLRANTSNAFADLDPSEITSTGGATDCAAAWAICITSFVLFCIGLYASIRYHKSREEVNSDESYYDKMRVIRRLSDRIQQQTTEIKAIESNSRSEQTMTLQAYEYAVGHQRRLIALGERAITTYIQHNVRSRPDGACPDCFTDVPSYQYSSVFQHATTQQ